MGFAQRDRTNVAAPFVARWRMGLCVRTVWGSACLGAVAVVSPSPRFSVGR